jgi:homogentisate 1,2-dioxygenase
MHHYSQGKHTTQAHKGIPEGHFEEEQGHGGFFGKVSHLIKKTPSTRWVEIEGPLKPRMFDLVELPKSDHIQRLFYNNYLNLSYAWIKKTTEKDLTAKRNADGDLAYFCHQGKGEVLTEYGLLKFDPGTYVIIPKCLTHVFVADEDTQFLVIENRNSHYQEPDRGMVGRNAFYDSEAIRKPDLDALYAEMKTRGLDVKKVEVKHSDEITKFLYDANIFDAVGWKGDLYPYTLHMNDMMPLMSHRAHLPPSAHTTLVAKDFVICSFLPRPLETDADALRVPFYHQNVDYDEILFYHNGDFFSRANLHSGMMSFHPAGFPHGPHPKAATNIKGKTHTNEYAVMIDSRWPLKRDPILDKVELKEYWKSWAT